MSCSLPFPTRHSTRLTRFFSSTPSKPQLIPSLQPSNDADLISQILLQHHNPFHSMESSLQLHGISLSPTLLHQTLLRLHSFSKVAFAFFSWAKTQPFCVPDAVAYNIVIDILGKVKQFDVAWQLVVEMDQVGRRPGRNTFRVLIRRLIAGGFTRQAIRVFEDMGCFVVGEDDEGCSDMIYLVDTLCKYGYVKVATEVFNRKKMEFGVNERVYTVLIDGWWKVNNRKMAERFFGEMIEVGIEPNVVTYNVVLNGMCRRRSLHPEERFERTVQDARRVFEEMRDRGVEPDVTSYSILLHVYSRAHKPDLSLDMLKEMRREGICPSVASYTSVVKCLCSCGRVKEAEELGEEMAGNGVAPSAVTYNCFFKEYRGRKDADSALALYRKMKGISLSLPSMHTYNILVGMFVKLNRMEIVEEIWDDMKVSGAGPDLDSYTLLIHALCEKDKWKEACQFFVEMIEKGILPQKVTFETLYKGLIQSDMLRTWRRLKKKLEEESISFGSEFEQYHLKPYRR
ncbi:hypothetical protein ACET3Z_019953 [Daucus carota]